MFGFSILFLVTTAQSFDNTQNDQYLDKKIDKLTTKAWRKFDNDNYKEAAEIARRILLYDSMNIDANTILGHVEKNNANYSQALEYYKRDLVNDTTDYEVYWGMAYCLSNFKKYREAINCLNRAFILCPIEKRDDRVMMLTSIGYNYDKLLRFDEAIIEYTKSLEYDEDYGQAYWNRGAVYEEKYEYQKAINDYTRALKYFKKSPSELANLYKNIGWNNSELGKYDEAIKFYDIALGFHPDYIEVLIHEGFTYTYKKDYNNALATFSKAIGLCGHDSEMLAELYSDRGECYDKMKEYDLARKDAEFSLKTLPDNQQANTLIGYSYLYTGKFIDSKVYFMKALNKDTADVYGYYNLACYYSVAKDKESSLVWLDKAFKHGYNDFDHIAKDEDLNEIKEDEKFKQLLVKYNGK